MHNPPHRGGKWLWRGGAGVVGDQLLSTEIRKPSLWLGLVVCLLLLQISNWWYPTPDGGRYLSIARSIAEGRGLSNLGTHERIFSPGYPLLLSFAFLWSDRPFLIISCLNCAAALVLLSGVRRWARRYAGEGAWLIAGLVLINAGLWTVYRRSLSEVTFMAVMIWAVNVTNSILRSESRPGLARMAFASLSLVALSTVRLAGLVFVAAFWAAAALRSRREPIVWPLQTCALFIGLPAVLAAFWLLQSDRVMPQLVRFQHPALPASPGALGVQILEGLRLRIGEVGRLVIPGMFKSYGPPGDWLNPNMIAFLPLFSAVGWGWWLMSRRNQDVALLAVPFYFGLFVFWPYDQGTRYFLPLLPMMLLSLWALFRPLGTRAEMPLFVLFLAHLSVSVGYWVHTEIPRGESSNAQWVLAERLVQAVQADPAPVYAIDVPASVQRQVEFLADRPVEIPEDLTQVTGKKVWAIAPEFPSPASSGFKPALSVQGLTLYRQDP